MVRVQVKGGKFRDISEEAEMEAQAMLGSYLKKGHHPSFSGRSDDVRKRYGFIFRQTGLAGYKGYLQTQYRPSEKEMRFAEAQAWMRAKPGEIVKTPAMLGTLQQRGTYIDPSGAGMSIGEEQLQKGIEEGQIKAGGTYRDVKGGFWSYKAQEVKPSFVKDEKEIEKFTQPYFQERVVGSFKADGRTIPSTQLYYIDPNTGEERIATDEEKKDFRSQTRVLQTGEEEGRYDFNLGGLNRLLDTAKREKSVEYSRTEGFGKFTTGAELTLLGFIAPFVGITTAVLNPLRTGESIVEMVKDPIGTFEQIKSSTRTSFKISPEYSTGRFLGEIALIKSPTLIVKGTDFLRTIKLKKVPTESIVAPEYFKGQIFPTISRGETAGQLLKEFEVKGAGFTTAPKPFAKSTIAGRGSSELAGVYQSPDISPHFLRVSGEQKLFSWRIFDTLRPSAMRITPTSFELVPGVSWGQKGLGSLPKAQSFLEKAPKGKSYVPFVKTEKEAIIPAGTELKLISKDVFFEFEGRKIPVFEFKTISSKGKPLTITEGIGGKTFTTEDIFSSYGRITTKGRITPLELTSVAKSLKSSYAKPSLKSSLVSPRPSRKVTYTPSIISYVRSQKSARGLTSRGGVSRGGRLSYGFLGYRGISYAKFPPARGGAITTTTITPPYKPFTRKRKKEKFSVHMRRFGKFKPIGTGLSLAKAFEVGRLKAARTLGATFKVTPSIKGLSAQLKTPKGFYRKVSKKEGAVFIELPKYRLSKPTEVSEIQRARKRKKKK